MYKVTKINKSAVTNFIELLNLDTGTPNICFDDSALFGINTENFEFMEEGAVYVCKIELFGKFEATPTPLSSELTIIETGVIVGSKNYLKVSIDSDLYYIPEAEAKNVSLERHMNYEFTRKDLIQVDNAIHADCL